MLGFMLTFFKNYEKCVITYYLSTLYDLFLLHAKARGVTIDEEFDADKEYNIIFDVDKATDIDDIISNYL